jgi:hypothetical protein
MLDTRLLIGALVLAVGAALAVALAIKRRQPLRVVFRQEGDNLVVAARALAVLVLLLGLAVLMVINNR